MSLSVTESSGFLPLNSPAGDMEALDLSASWQSAYDNATANATGGSNQLAQVPENLVPAQVGEMMEYEIEVLGEFTMVQVPARALASEDGRALVERFLQYKSVGYPGDYESLEQANEHIPLSLNQWDNLYSQSVQSHYNQIAQQAERDAQTAEIQMLQAELELAHAQNRLLTLEAEAAQARLQNSQSIPQESLAPSEPETIVDLELDSALFDLFAIPNQYVPPEGVQLFASNAFRGKEMYLYQAQNQTTGKWELRAHSLQPRVVQDILVYEKDTQFGESDFRWESDISDKTRLAWKALNAPENEITEHQRVLLYQQRSLDTEGEWGLYMRSQDPLNTSAILVATSPQRIPESQFIWNGDLMEQLATAHDVLFQTANIPAQLETPRSSSEPGVLENFGAGVSTGLLMTPAYLAHTFERGARAAGTVTQSVLALSDAAINMVTPWDSSTRFTNVLQIERRAQLAEGSTSGTLAQMARESVGAFFGGDPQATAFLAGEWASGFVLSAALRGTIQRGQLANTGAQTSVSSNWVLRIAQYIRHEATAAEVQQFAARITPQQLNNMLQPTNPARPIAEAYIMRLTPLPPSSAPVVNF